MVIVFNALVTFGYVLYAQAIVRPLFTMISTETRPREPSGLVEVNLTRYKQHEVIVLAVGDIKGSRFGAALQW